MHRSFATLASALLICVACSGGGGGGGNVEGGIGGSGITRGVITRVGSATVARTTYDTDGAEVMLDGVAGVPANLAVGMKVTIEGTRDSEAGTGTATRVEFDDDLEGRIEVITDVDFDLDGTVIASELTIFDRTVLIRRDGTSFEGTDFDGIAELDFVEVSGFVDVDDVIFATRIEAKSGPEVELRGEVENHVANGGNSSFDIGGVEILYDATVGGGTDLSGVPAGIPENGDFVEVEGDFVDAAHVDARVGGSIEIEDAVIGGDFDDFEIEGIVTNFFDLSSFEVDGQVVDASRFGVSFVPGAFAVKNGALVEVEGALVNGLLVAKKVELRESEARIDAQIALTADIDVAAGTFLLLGAVEVRVDAGTRFEPCDDVPDLDGIDKLEGLDFVEVRGVDVDPTDGGMVLATLIKCDQVDDVELRGRVQGASPLDRTFTILGVEIPVGDLTEFSGFPDDPGLDDEADFFAFIASQGSPLLDVKDETDTEVPMDATTLDVADSVEPADS